MSIYRQNTIFESMRYAALFLVISEQHWLEKKQNIEMPFAHIF